MEIPPLLVVAHTSGIRRAAPEAVDRNETLVGVGPSLRNRAERKLAASSGRWANEDVCPPYHQSHSAKPLKAGSAFGSSRPTGDVAGSRAQGRPTLALR